MHMNADYPLMLPRITERTATTITLAGRDGPVTLTIRRRRDGREFARYAQKSAFEIAFRRPATSFDFEPFKDERTEPPAASGVTRTLPGL
jgi:hypothetical protein